MVFDFIKKMFPIKADSLDGFIEVVKREGGVFVIATPIIRLKNWFSASRNTAVGTIGNYEYSTRLQSKTPEGRQIVFCDVGGLRFGSDSGFSDSKKRGLYALRNVLTADDRLQNVKQRLPNVKTELVGPEGIIDEATRQRMYADAKKYNVTPF